MPSHIFTRVGHWRDSVESNCQSARVDGDRTVQSPHAYDYMVYAQLQLGQDKAAAEVLSHAVRVTPKWHCWRCASPSVRGGRGAVESDPLPVPEGALASERSPHTTTA